LTPITVFVKSHKDLDVTVSEAAQEDSDDPLFGMWHDRAEMADVQAYVRKLRASRF